MPRKVDVALITDAIKDMCIEANHFLTPDMDAVLKEATEKEEAPLGKQVLSSLQDNLKIAGRFVRIREWLLCLPR